MGQNSAKLRASSDWTETKDEKPSPPVGTDVTYREGDLLKFTNRTVDYNPDAPLPNREEVEGVPGAFLVHNLLTLEECRQYIEISEEMEYSQAPLRNLDTLNSTNFSLDNSTIVIRNSLRVLFDCPDQIAKTLNQRLLPFLDAQVECEGKSWKVCTEEPINKRWRFNRYNKGNFFKPHFDAGFVYSDTKKTLFTFILYLNEGCEGGETTFYPGNKKFAWEKPQEGIERKIVPKAGTALVFFQSGDLNPRHEGAEVLSEDKLKYILRSDLAYERIPDGAQL
eukprot:Phypoly_transcript_12043.p1 GENE.Phypoly_transcript_12043~~Phypoly_transcript_12043.p1  ORF type:complete len:280 (+),score=50.74 Phypoly_transcript_12043:171-1010(+)